MRLNNELKPKINKKNVSPYGINFGQVQALAECNHKP